MLGAIFAAYLLVLLTEDRRISDYKAQSEGGFLYIDSCLFFLGGISTSTHHHNLTQNYQTTQSEVAGMATIFECRDRRPIIWVYLPLGDLLICSSILKRNVQRLPLYVKEVPPWHFGYDREFSLSLAYDEETDLVITQRDKVIYKDCYPEMAQYRYTNQDFERLGEDPGVNLLYSNGGFDLWKVTMTN